VDEFDLVDFLARKWQAAFNTDKILVVAQD